MLQKVNELQLSARRILDNAGFRAGAKIFPNGDPGILSRQTAVGNGFRHFRFRAD
jgi:hypothetical protein